MRQHSMMVAGGPGIEVEGEHGRHLDPGCLRERRVQLQRGELREPDQRGLVVDQGEVDRAGPVGEHGRRLHPLRAVLGAALLEEVEALDPVGVALQRGRAAAQVRDHRVGDPRVVVDHLGLGEPGLRVEDLVEVGQLELAPADRDFATSSQPWPSPSAWPSSRPRTSALAAGFLAAAFFFGALLAPFDLVAGCAVALAADGGQALLEGGHQVRRLGGLGLLARRADDLLARGLLLRAAPAAPRGTRRGTCRRRSRSRATRSAASPSPARASRASWASPRTGRRVRSSG